MSDDFLLVADLYKQQMYQLNIGIADQMSAISLSPNNQPLTSEFDQVTGHAIKRANIDGSDEQVVKIMTAGVAT